MCKLMSRKAGFGKLVRKVIEAFGRLDILVSNAGMNVLRVPSFVVKTVGLIILI